MTYNAGKSERPEPYSSSVIILGDSFVSRLEASINHVFYNSPASKIMSLNEFARDALKAPQEVHKIYFSGIGGAGLTTKTRKVYLPPHKLLIESRPRYAILDIGGNDLDSPATPQEVAEAKLSLANTLTTTYDISYVALTSILPRDSLRYLSPDLFREKALQANLTTSNLTLTTPLICFHRHKGFWRDHQGTTANTTEWSTDGVHTNTEIGMRKYQKSITRCLHNMIKTCHSLPCGP